MDCIDKLQKNQPSSAAQNPKGPLPCLNSNNYTDNLLLDIEQLTPYHRKQAFSLVENVQRFVKEVGIDNIGFLTLTFPDNVIEHSEALKRWNSLRTHFISRHFGRWMLVKERQVRGAIHYHLLVEVFFDIRTGFNFDEVFPTKGRRPIYRSASPQLRNLWKELREAMPNYGFGRAELAPIKTNDEAMSKYVGKYISKDKGQKNDKYKELDKGARMIAYSQNWPRSNTKFAWNSDGAKEWRRKTERFAKEYVGVSNMLGLQITLGSKWAYRFKEEIFNIDQLLENGKTENMPPDIGVKRVQRVCRRCSKEPEHVSKTSNRHDISDVHSNVSISP